MAAGTLTTYTQDYAAPLPVVLQAKTGAAATQYVYSLGTRPVAEYEEAAAWEYLIPDPLGSVRQIANASGNVTLLKSYEPYGSVLNSQGSAASIFGYSGEQVDAYIKLVFLRARYYSPETARFLSKDMWQGDYTRPQSFNGWGYVEDNPINFTDPSGLIKEGPEAEDADEERGFLSRVYGIEIRRDYGPYQFCIPESAAPPGGPAPVVPDCYSGWHEGAWRSVDELKLVSRAANYMSQAMGGHQKFKSAMRGPVQVTRWAGSTYLSFVPPDFVGALLGVGDMVLTDNAFNGTEEFKTHVVIHEFGHVWDKRTGYALSDGMASALGTKVCEQVAINGVGLDDAQFIIPFVCMCRFDITAQSEPPPGPKIGPHAGDSALEDWAEAFATYVYPDYYSQDPFNLNNPLGALRRQYVENQIRSIP